jgi:predicted nucleic acid-binding protein
MPAYPLTSLASGEEVLLDANIIVYGVNVKSAQCRDLLRRCATGDVSGYTTVEILAEACHRLMLSEAVGRGLIQRPNASSLQGKGHVIRQLQDYWIRLENLRAGALAVLPLDEYRFARAQGLRQQHGLMTNDSLVLAAADVFGIPALSTNDDDFDNVLWLDIYKPNDLSTAAP